MTAEPFRPAWVEVDLAVLDANVRALAGLVAPAALAVVVKADAYGHGATTVAPRVVAAGADLLAVATVEEGRDLRACGVDAAILVLGDPASDAAAAALVESGLEATVSRIDTVERLTAAAATAGRSAVAPVPVHVKVNTGMNRLGCPPDQAVEVAAAVHQAPGLELRALWTHLAVADDPQRPETARQLERFDDALAAVRAAGVPVPLVHVANSAGSICHPATRRDLVRCGIAVYGIAPSPLVDLPAGIAPALSLRARVTHLTRVPAGEGVSYGLGSVSAVDRTVATLPIGYADGIDRHVGHGLGSVLIGGRRRRILGSVTMDQILVDCGDDPVQVGDEAVLIGRQGDETITAAEWAGWIGTIGYEVVTRLGARLPRRFTGDSISG